VVPKETEDVEEPEKKEDVKPISSGLFSNL
jgi:Nucleoporin FG repeat region